MNDKTERPQAISDQNIAYYNAIASNYDQILDKDAANALSRAKVSALFTSIVASGSVLDFGGGTGQDLGWLIKSNYQVLFCEPSLSMRNIALERTKLYFAGANIRFLHNEECDFRSWPASFPATGKIDAVLANFAVINCIPDIQTLFAHFAKLLKPGGWIVALVLENSLRKRLSSNFKGTLASLFSPNPVRITVNYNGRKQIVYLHTMQEIKRAMGDEFSFFYREQLRGFGFRLICLQRK
jgi:SAM-dependent methyltransferase